MSLFILDNILVIIGGACWGSFLNVLAVRGIRQMSFLEPSRCSVCAVHLPWWQLLPIISWIFLTGRCYYCRTRISPWYPIIEYLTALWMWSLFIQFPLRFFFALSILSSALIVTIRTDAEHFLILRWCTLGILPFAIAAATYGYLPMTITQSIIGLLVGGGYFLLVRTCFLWWKGYDGLGEGDVELAATIGAFVGVIGLFSAVLFASCLGVAYGLVQRIKQPLLSLQTPIPFGVCLALGTWATLLTKMF